VSDHLEPELDRIARMLREAGPLPDAPASLRDRALAIPDGAEQALPVAGAPPAAVPAPPRPTRGRRQWWRPVPLAGLAVLLIAIAVPVLALVRDGDQRVEMAAREFAPEGGGVAMVDTSGSTATIKLRVWKMPRPGAGKTYEAWLGRRGERKALGTFGIDAEGTATVSFEVERDELEDSRWLWVTSEPAGGSPEPSEQTALWGRLT
jgi:anti-sigma-K factor RskA